MIEKRDVIKEAIEQLDHSMTDQNRNIVISFEEILHLVSNCPHIVIRNVFQVFYDMLKNYLGQGYDEYPDDPESINYIFYDCSRLFVEDVDNPFFADRLFANRLVNLVDAMKRGAQQNKIYIFEGPHGCGKSTFLNNLLNKFEKYANTDDGTRFEIVWRLDRQALGGFAEQEAVPVIERLFQALDTPYTDRRELLHEHGGGGMAEGYIEIPCPSHDNPILIIPKEHRRSFFDDLVKNDEFKWKLYTEKEYEWVFKDTPCTICSSMYEALLTKLKHPQQVFKMIWARPYGFTRRLGEGISVFNPGDKPVQRNVMGNAMLQSRLNNLLKDSNRVNYIFSRYAKTNNGIYALMDIKSHNIERLIELHNIISEGVHKVEDIEENVDSLFLALMNPEDKKNIQDIPSFSDRIEFVKILYVLDLNTEVEIYRNVFGKHIDDYFLPRVLHNFARVVISSRLNIKSDALLEWIEDPGKYRQYCDENLQLLKMEIYTGYIPGWLKEEDVKRFTAKRRRKIISESESEGIHGFSGRDSIKIFNDFYSQNASENKLINMSTLCQFFRKLLRSRKEAIPEGFLDSMLRMYDYTVLQEVKESLYYYNEEQIAKDIQNYLFAINFEAGAVETCHYTGDRLEITESFLEGIESRLLDETDREKRREFRGSIQKDYTTKALTQEIMVGNKPITETELYHNLYERYVQHLKEKVLDPFLENENFRRAIKDYGEEDFKTYDKRIRDDVAFLINNLQEKLKYTKKGAKEVCIYVIDNDLAHKFGGPAVQGNNGKKP